MKAKRWIIILSLLPVLYCPIARAQKMTVTGRVIDHQARPVKDAMVVYYDLSHHNSNLLGKTRTTTNGRFSFQVEIKDSSPYLVAYKQGLALGWSHILNHMNELSPTIRLGQPRCFKGVVIDETGRPVSDALVKICMKNEMMARDTIFPFSSEGWFTTRTDTQEQFIFDKIPEGSTADFGIEAPGRASIWTICDFGLWAGEQFTAGRTDIRIVLPLEACIKGQVIEKDTGRGVPKVLVEAIPYGEARRSFCKSSVQTESNGQFGFTGLAPDKYLLQVISNEKGSGNVTVTLESGQDMRDVKIPLSGIPFEVIVYDSEKGEPLESTRVTVTQREAEFPQFMFRQTVFTDPNGLARFNVPSGECEVEAWKDDYGMTFHSQRVQLDPGKMLRYEMSVPRTACILSGDVVDEQGHPLQDTTVMEVGFGLRTLTDAKGRFDTSHIGYHTSRLPSKVRVLARHIPSGLGAIGVLEDPNKSGRPHGRINLKPAYTFTGRVTDPNDRSIPAAHVKLILGQYRTFVTEMLTDPNGVYSIRSVPPLGDDVRDSYIITACAEGFGITQFVHIPFYGDTTEPVRLDPIVLQPADQIISGVVEDANHQSVAGAIVTVYGPRLSTTVSQPPCGKTLTDAQGRFRITGVCKEPLQVYAESPSAPKQRGETWAHGGSENVKVVPGQKFIFSKSLVGKIMPGFEDIDIGFNPQQAKDRIFLIYFFDLEQRPSRYGLIELAKQAESLEQKNIIMVAVQVSKVDQKKLGEWVKKNDIPFPIGRVVSEEDKTRLNWGVRSLPWLILTDTQHIVCAEGFGISELNDKLK